MVLDASILLVVSLAVFRISLMIVSEDGPFTIFPRFKRWIGVRYDQYSQVYATNEFAKLFTCVWCLSLWLGLAVTVFAYFFPVIAFWVAMPFACSAVAVILSGRLKD